MMRTTKLPAFVVVLALLGLPVTPAFADFIELPIKWSQLPDMNIGMDHLSIHPTTPGGDGPVVADDYLSSTRDPIVAVRWWGSYIGYEGAPPPEYTLPPGFAVPFHIGFYTDVPAGVDGPFSHPGALVYDVMVAAQEEFFAWVPDPEAVFMYNAYLPYPFDQQVYHQPTPDDPTVLWLRIDRMDRDDWGWHEGLPPFMDAAVTGPHLGPWTPLLKKNGLPADMAFELMTFASTPEPSPALLTGLGGLLLLLARRRRSTRG